MLSASDFLAANSYLTNQKRLNSWIFAPPTKAPILILGVPGFDAQGLARWLWSLAQDKRRPFRQTTSEFFRTKSQLMIHAEGLSGGDLLLQGTSLINQKKLACVAQALAEKNVRLILALEHSSETFAVPFQAKEIFEARILRVPSLASRKLDTNFLINTLMPKHALEYDAIRVLMDYSWPGDYEELSLVATRMNEITSRKEILSGQKTREVLQQKFFPLKSASFKQTFPIDQMFDASQSIGLKKLSELLEASLIAKALEVNRGRKSLAARYLKMKPSTLQSRIEALSGLMDFD